MGRRTRLLLGLAGFALLAAFLTRGVRPAGSSRAGPEERPAPTPPPEAQAPPGASPESSPLPSRNPFRYGGEAKPVLRLPSRPEASPALPPPTPSPIRFVGLVTREGKLRAALSVSGDVLVAGPGEEVAGYRVLAIDEETGVRVRGPDGREILLRLEH